MLLDHGVPRVILRDRGRSFLAQPLREILSTCSTLRKFPSGKHPPTNELTERFNHTLADMLPLYVSSQHTNWYAVTSYLT